MSANDLSTTYGPVLRKIQAGIGTVNFEPKDEKRMRELIIELEELYNQAAKRMAKSAK